jgi:hypothetical protein
LVFPGLDPDLINTAKMQSFGSIFCKEALHSFVDALLKNIPFATAQKKTFSDEGFQRN